MEENKKEEVQEDNFEDLIDSENVNNNLQLLARAIESKFKNWFPLGKLYKVNEVNFFKQDEQLALMTLLCQKGLAHHKIENGLDHFKITLDKQIKIDLLEEDIKYHEERISYLKREIERLRK